EYIYADPLDAVRVLERGRRMVVVSDADLIWLAASARVVCGCAEHAGAVRAADDAIEQVAPFRGARRLMLVRMALELGELSVGEQRRHSALDGDLLAAFLELLLPHRAGAVDAPTDRYRELVKTWSLAAPLLAAEEMDRPESGIGVHRLGDSQPCLTRL